jgi:hypothetical protein
LADQIDHEGEGEVGAHRQLHRVAIGELPDGGDVFGDQAVVDVLGDALKLGQRVAARLLVGRL